MAMILASSTSPVHVRTIILETSFVERYQPNPFILRTPDKWLAIDAILASPNFVDLHTVEVTLNGYPPASSEMQQTSLDLGEIDFTALLPTISYYSRISLMTLTTLVSRKETAVYHMDPVDYNICRVVRVKI